MKTDVKTDLKTDVKRLLFTFFIGLYTLLAFSAAVREPVAGNAAVADTASVVCVDDGWLADNSDDSALVSSGWRVSPERRHVYTRPAVLVSAGYRSMDRPRVRAPPVNLRMS